MKLNKISHHEQDFGKKNTRIKQIEIDIPEKNKELKKYNKNVDNSGIVNSKNGANLDFNA